MLNVVIAEDEDIIRQGLVHVIDWNSMDCRVAGAARDGEEGFQLICALRPDIVITDIKMRHRNGLQMVEEALKICQFKTIILTSYPEFDYARKAVTLHVFEYLLKPVNAKLLGTIIARIRSELEHDPRYLQRIMKTGASGNPTAVPSPDGGTVSFDIVSVMEHCSDRYVRLALKKIIMAYNEHISVARVAGEIGVSASYLSRKFRECTGRTFVEVLNMRRIHQAVELLEQGGYLMYEIATICGFSEYKYFCAVFKKYTGRNPTSIQNEAALQ